MDWKSYFEMMIDWKKLPAYKAEPRIDSLIGYYLKDFLSDYLKEEIVGIIPELPIRLGTIKPELENTISADRSYKVDFFAVGSKGKNYLIEFKTDMSSRREKQDDYLLKTKMKGTKELIEGIIKISKASTYTDKYNHLKSKLIEYKLLNSKLTYTEFNEDLEIIYVQPSNDKGIKEIINFEKIAEWLESNFQGSSFEQEFSKALRVWAEI
jgi:hypothetical protein